MTARTSVYSTGFALISSRVMQVLRRLGYPETTILHAHSLLQIYYRTLKPLSSLVEPIPSSTLAPLREVAGVLWQSWEEFAPVPGLSQIVGHTPATQPRILRQQRGVNYCIDTHSAHYAVMEENGSIHVRSVLDEVVMS
jgi:hypothetical protein